MKSEVKVNKDNDLEFPFLGSSNYSGHIYIVLGVDLLSDDYYKCSIIVNCKKDSINSVGDIVAHRREDMDIFNGQVILSN